MTKKIWPIILIAIIVIIFFYRIIFLGHVLVDMSALSDKLPWSAHLPQYFTNERPPYTSSDSSTVYFPTFKFYSEAWKNNEFPLWWPYLTGGYPIIANSTALILNPFSILMLVLPPITGYTYSLIIKIFLAGVGLFLFCRLLKIPRWPSIIGAIVYMFNTLVMLKLEIPWMTQTIWNLPFLFFFLEKTFREKKFINYFIASLLLAFQFVGAHPQTGFYVAVFAAIYVLVRVLRKIKSKINPKKHFAFHFLPFILLPFLAAIQLLPMFELQSLGHRSPNELPQWISPIHLYSALIPQLFGDTQTNFNAFAKIERNILNSLHLNFPTIPIPYIGILPLIFVLLGVFKKIRHNFYVLFFALSAGILLLLQLTTPLWSEFGQIIPFINKMWNTYRMNVVYVFSISVLTAFGAKYFLEASQKYWQTIKKIIFYFFIFLSPVILICILLPLPLVSNQFLHFGQKISANSYQNNGEGKSQSYYQNELESWYQLLKNHFSFKNPTIYVPFLILVVISFLFFLHFRKKISTQSLKIITLFLIIGDLFYIGWIYNPTPTRTQDVFQNIPPISFLQKDKSLYRVSNTDGWNLIFPNSLANYNISDIGVEYNIYPRRYDEYMSFIENNERASLAKPFHTSLWLTNYNSPLLSIFNVKYIITPPDQNIESKKFQLVYDQEIKIYKNNQALPRVFLVPEAKVISDERAILNYLNDPSFNPLKEAVFEKQPSEEGSANLQGSSATITEYTPNEVKINATLTYHGYLIFSDLYYPGWQVTIDGHQDKIYRANYLSRGLALTKGEHKIVFQFKPKLFTIGAIISLATLLILIFLQIYFIKKETSKA